MFKEEYMRIKEIKEINNYRNLSGLTVSFSESLNYIIGENNIGKTNILELINSIFSTGKFVEKDFFDITQPISIRFSIEYEDECIGFFEDNFDVDDSNAITLVAEQEVVDGRISYYHDTPNMTPISYSTVRKINTLYYYAQRMPSKEVDFKRTSGSGKVLNYLIQKSLAAVGLEECDVLNRNELDNVIKEINKSVEKISSITGDPINACLDPVMDKVISRILLLGDENGRELSSLGEGIQYAFSIILQIIDEIYDTKISRKPEEFEERVVSVNGQKYYPVLLLLDEPEIHQHPYRQRSMIKKIEEIMNNRNCDFCNLLKDLFDIDGLIGQVFIATHSPNILLNDYKEFTRVYKQKATNRVSIVSGVNIDLDDQLYKHLLHNYIYLKEAMFSKQIIFVEGDTENGAIPVFAKRMGFDLDENGVGVIKLDGADSVKPCLDLYNQFGMKAYAIIDRDKMDSYVGTPNVFFTTENDYEEDVYSNFKFYDYLMCCKELNNLDSLIGSMKRRIGEFDYEAFKRDPHSLEIDEVVGDLILAECKENQLRCLKGSKNASKGALLAQYVTTIPSAFSDLIDLIKG